MYCSSFSKKLMPGLRIGWTAPGLYQTTVEWLKFSASLAVATLPQHAVASFMADGGFRKHLRRIFRVYQQCVSGLHRAVIRYFPQDIRVTDPSGGFLLWIELPAVSMPGALQEGTGKEIVITPGHLFSTGERYRHFIHLNAAN